MLPIKITMNENIRELIKTKRNELGMSGATLSQLINQKSSYISAVENGRIKKMSLESLENIVKKLFGCDNDDAENIIKKYLTNSETINVPNMNLEKDVNLNTTNKNFSQDKITKYKTVENSTKDITLDDLIKNMKLGFETVQKVDSKFTISTLERLVTSMHFDLGFMMALFHIPYFALKGLTHEERQKFLDDVSDIFKKYVAVSEEHIESKKIKESTAEDRTSDGTPDDSVDDQTKN